jgi:hypothetical protein
LDFAAGGNPKIHQNLQIWGQIIAEVAGNTKSFGI